MQNFNKLSFMAFALLAASANAQTSVEPGSIEKRFNAPLRQEVSPKTLIPETADIKPAKNAENITFILNKMTITGSTAVPGEELEQFYKDSIGKKISLADVYTIAQNITRHLRGKGYVLSRALVPAQEIDGGKVKIQVVEGHINKVIINGKTNSKIDKIERMLNKITEEKPITSEVLERYLLLVNDLAGVSANSVLTPSNDSLGGADLIVNISQKSYAGALGSDNRGSEFLGPIQFFAQGDVNSMLGQYERMSLRGITVDSSKELRFFDFTYEQPINDEGTKATFIFARGISNPGGSVKDLDLEGYSSTFSAELEHPFIRSRKTNLKGRFGFNLRDTESYALDVRLSEDRIRTLNLGAKYDTVDGLNGINVADIEVLQGIKAFNTSDDGLGRSRFNAKTLFTKITGQLERLQPLKHGISLLVGTNWQYANDPLPASEEFILGGSEYGRAYDPAEIAGDDGIAGKIELQYGRSPDKSYLDSYQVYSYYDIGAVWNKKTLATEQKKQTLASAGVGVRLNFTDTLSGSVEASLPLTRKVAAEGTEGDNPRFFFSLTKRF